MKLLRAFSIFMHNVKHATQNLQISLEVGANGPKKTEKKSDNGNRSTVMQLLE